GLGHFFGAMRIDAFRPAQDFKKNMDQWISRFREAKPISEDQPVLVPGDPEREMYDQRMDKGIPLLQPVIEDLEQLGSRFGISFPEN
ncbi:MAG: Ldh family oxidoreductase, partial [Chitinophagaceae bacterium]